MILTGHQIKQAVEAGALSITPFDEKQIQPASYDFRIGDQGATVSAKRLINIKKEGVLVLEPGDFGLLVTLEEIKLGNKHVGRFGLRSGYARKGIHATTGPQIDPGYHGRMIIGVTNMTPQRVSFPYKDDFLTIELHQLEEPAEEYDGPYQGIRELRPEDIQFILEREGAALPELLQTMRSLSTNVGKLSADVRTLKWVIPIIVGAGMAVVAILTGIAIAST